MNEKLWPPTCPTCGKNKWRTKEVGKKYVCRNCGYVREKPERIRKNEE